jgi:WD40 repeat protein
MDTPRPSAGPFAQEGIVVAVALSPDGKRLVTLGPDDRTAVWEVASGKEIGPLATTPLFRFPGNETRRRQRDNSDWLHSAAFVDNDTLISWANDPPPRLIEKPPVPYFIGAALWNVITGKPLARFSADNCFALSPDRRTLAVNVGRKVVLWELATRQERIALDVEDTGARAIGLCDGGKALAVAFPEWTVRLWDAATGQPLQRHDLKFTGPIPRPHNGLIFSPDGEHLIPAGSWDGTLRRWEARTGKELPAFALHPRLVHNVVYSADGTRLAAVGKGSAGKGETILVIETTTGKAVHRIPRPANEAGVTTLALALDGKTIAAGTIDGRTWLWSIA